MNDFNIDDIPPPASLTDPQEEFTPMTILLSGLMSTLNDARANMIALMDQVEGADEDAREFVEELLMEQFGTINPYEDKELAHNDRLRYVLTFMILSLFVRLPDQPPPNFDGVEGVTMPMVRLAWKQFVSDLEDYYPEVK